MTATLNLPPIEKYSTFRHRLIWKGANQQPIDLTGCSAKLQLRKNVGDTVLLELSTTNNRILLGGVDGTIDLIIAKADTADLAFKNAKYDLLITMANGEAIRLCEGIASIHDGITQ